VPRIIANFLSKKTGTYPDFNFFHSPSFPYYFRPNREV
jgi:hypothetical protein